MDETAEEEVQEDEDGIPTPARNRATIVEANLTKRQMAFVSPRLGVLNNSECSILLHLVSQIMLSRVALMQVFLIFQF